MPAPGLTFSATGNIISAKKGFDSVSVTFSSDIPYINFECRATKENEPYGVGIGALVASFSYTPENTSRTFEIYYNYLTSGDGKYRISLYAQGEDGVWNDNYGFIPVDSTGLITNDGKIFLCVR